MSTATEEKANDKKQLQSRLIGKYTSDNPGPLLLVTAGVHGNEPSGVIGLQRVFEKLEEEKPPISGTFIGLVGNLGAIKKEKRFIDKDLNRVWPLKRPEDFEPETAEEKEMQEIWNILDDYPEEDFEERYFVDCHSTSSQSVPYISVQDVGKNNSFAHQFPLYIVRGFSDLVEGSIDRHFSHNGFTGFTFEGGQHEAESTVHNQEGVIWLALQKASGLALENIDELQGFVDSLTPEDGSCTFDIVYRHNIDDGDRFQMKPDYKNFQKIEEGEYLADHNGEKIISRWNARIFMPLYQSQGNDGFFVIEENEQ